MVDFDGFHVDKYTNRPNGSYVWQYGLRRNLGFWKGFGGPGFLREKFIQLNFNKNHVTIPGLPSFCLGILHLFHFTSNCEKGSIFPKANFPITRTSNFPASLPNQNRKKSIRSSQGGCEKKKPNGVVVA